MMRKKLKQNQQQRIEFGDVSSEFGVLSSESGGEGYKIRNDDPPRADATEAE